MPRPRFFAEVRGGLGGQYGFMVTCEFIDRCTFKITTDSLEDYLPKTVPYILYYPYPAIDSTSTLHLLESTDGVTFGTAARPYGACRANSVKWFRLDFSSPWEVEKVATFFKAGNYVPGVSEWFEYVMREDGTGTNAGYANAVFQSIASQGDEFERPTATPLSTPIGLNATNITSNSALVSWAQNANASNFKIEYKINGDTSWTQTTSD